jgi:hypothetical protein
MLEDCSAASAEIEFEIHDRHSRFSSNSAVELIDDFKE